PGRSGRGGREQEVEGELAASRQQREGLLQLRLGERRALGEQGEPAAVRRRRSKRGGPGSEGIRRYPRSGKVAVGQGPETEGGPRHPGEGQPSDEKYGGDCAPHGTSWKRSVLWSIPTFRPRRRSSVYAGGTNPSDRSGSI